MKSKQIVCVGILTSKLILNNLSPSLLEKKTHIKQGEIETILWNVNKRKNDFFIKKNRSETNDWTYPG